MAATMNMTQSVRRYKHEDDYWRMPDFLRGAYVSNNQRLPAWHVARLDYARWHVCPNVAGVQLWVLRKNVLLAHCRTDFVS